MWFAGVKEHDAQIAQFGRRIGLELHDSFLDSNAPFQIAARIDSFEIAEHADQHLPISHRREVNRVDIDVLTGGLQDQRRQLMAFQHRTAMKYINVLGLGLRLMGEQKVAGQIDADQFKSR